MKEIIPELAFAPHVSEGKFVKRELVEPLQEQILWHLERAGAEQSQSELPLVARGPPAPSSLL